MAGIGHITVGMAAARARAGDDRGVALPVLMVAWALLSMLPDADVAMFSFGVGYESIWGHRGVTHSLAFAAGMGLVVGGFVRYRGMKRPFAAGLLAACVVASHGLLDTLTDGGGGVALLWPFSSARFFAPWHPIPVSPIGMHVFSIAAIQVAARELLLFIPLLAFAVWPRGRRSPAAAHPDATPAS